MLWWKHLKIPPVDVDSILKDASESCVSDLSIHSKNKSFLEKVPHKGRDLSIIIYRVVINE